MEELSAVLRVIGSSEVPSLVLGCGSNVLVKDGGFRGVVVSLQALQEVKRREGNTLIASAGFTLKEISEWALEESLSGLEFAIGIPGSLGGAVFMNAGAYDGEMSQVLTKVRAVAMDGSIHEYTLEDMSLSYRHSVFQENAHIVGEVEMTLVSGEPAKIEALMVDLTGKRESKQPLEFASAGSTFKRPPGYFAGTLIDQTGLKGFSVGDAQVSEKHAGFVINRGKATAKDVLTLIGEVQRRVQEAHGVTLETEVRILGEE